MEQTLENKQTFLVEDKAKNIANILDKPISTSIRKIRSFVKRAGRVTASQQKALATLSSKFILAYQAKPLSASEIFGRHAPCILEIGFGMGEALSWLASRSLQANFFGIDVHKPGIGALLRELEVNELNNVRIIEHDATEVMQDMFKANSLDAVHIFFPDPWHKKRHNKRRLLQNDFVTLLAAKLKPLAYLRLATDNCDYANYMLGVLQEHASFINTLNIKNTDTNYVRPIYRPMTKFERKGLQAKNVILDLAFTKII